MNLRDATYSDWKFLLDLRNDDSTKENSFDQTNVDEEEHKHWLKQSLKNSKRRIRILCDETLSIPLGMIREDLWDNDISNFSNITLSWAIHPNNRGKGLGTKILGLAIKDRPETFYAEIKFGNEASIKMTKNNGFIDESAKYLDPNKERLYYTYKKRGPLEIIGAIEHVRNANNVNWMDLCRLAFTYAPKEARQIMRRVNSHDTEIADLLKELSDE